MRIPTRRVRAAAGALLCCAMLSTLSACSVWNRVFHRHRKDAGCTEKPFSQNTETRPALKVPDGLSAPDTRNAIKIPDLASPERVRAKSEPCLSRPPGYFATPPKAQPTQIPGAPITPMAPAPAPAPAPLPAPAPAPAPEGPATPK